MDSKNLLKEMLGHTVDEIEAWLEECKLPAEFNWLGLAEIAGQEALYGDALSALGWGRISITARMRLVAEAPGSTFAESQISNAMRLRSALICQHGPVCGDQLLDPAVVFDWFLSRHGYRDTVQVAFDAAGWRSFPIENIRELRRIKNDVGVLRDLGPIIKEAPVEILRWVDLWDYLP